MGSSIVTQKLAPHSADVSGWSLICIPGAVGIDCPWLVFPLRISLVLSLSLSFRLVSVSLLEVVRMDEPCGLRVSLEFGRVGVEEEEGEGKGRVGAGEFIVVAKQTAPLLTAHVANP